ncbi:ParB/RepB/Spo0J family partition protein [Bifidobacterium xylocopae]|uniref:Chromosome partitioning protein ParB n=1 Tax=Bifidobacterium xylocopae TaxID=2493119 RepID=A0A366KD73_9BIFI|nr:ParB/RepB/Spo0J family partition protein [Bifidobacterium xylocopae]RBP99670.1 chromosome partitioning protein ParB [Bifidobacterium xylocopae]
MAKRSRLGKGLGALFPALPGEVEIEEGEVKSVDADGVAGVDGDVKAPDSAQHKAESKTRSAAKTSGGSSGSTRGKSAAKGGSTGRKGTGSHATGHPKKTGSDVSHETSVKKQRSGRMSVPKLSALEHPSDLFFGGADDGVSRETPSTHEARGPRVAEGSQTDDSNQLKPVEGGYLVALRVDDIRANAEQPRRIFDEDELLELSRSIAEVGLLQPIVVREIHADSGNTPEHIEHYEIIMGERRWRASGLAGIETIPAIVKTTSDDEMLRDALLENLHRVALNPLEEAAAYQQMMNEFGMTQEELAKSVSKSRPQIANMLRLLKLPLGVQKKVESGMLSAGHARALLTLSTEADMDTLADRIISEGLSVRSTEELVALKTSAEPAKRRKHKPSVWAGSPVLHNLEDRFETKVDIKGSEKRGRIEITFSSPDDMNRILDLLLENAKPSSTSGQHVASTNGWV